MELEVIGVGFGRTGTNSLKLALEQLLGGRCHHMHEVFERPEVIPLWIDAAEGRADWAAVFDGDVATVDWPGAAFWKELVEEYPDAKVLLSKRETPEQWWRSASGTIFMTPDSPNMAPEAQAWLSTAMALIARHGVDPTDAEVSMAAYERHLDEVRAAVPPDRLIEWTTGDGWGPLCEGLGVPVPDEPFPHVNTSAEFRERLGLEA